MSLPKPPSFDAKDREKLNKFKAAVAKAEADSQNVPIVAAEYFESTDEDARVTHIDVKKFKEHWDATIGDSSMVSDSREKGVKYGKKERLRLKLMNYAVLHGIATSKAAWERGDVTQGRSDQADSPGAASNPELGP